MTNTNREETKQLQLVTASPNLALVNIKSFAKMDNIDTFAPAFVSAVLAFFAGVSFGQWKIAGDYRIVGSFAIGFITSWLAFNGFYLLALLMSSSRIKAEYWDGDGEAEPTDPPAAALIRTARYQQRIRLSSRMRDMLTRFARHYAEIGTMGITRWEQSKYFNQSQIISIRNYAVLIGAAVKDENNQATLTEWGRGQLSKWAAGDFGDVIELSDPPTPEEG